MPHKIFSLPSAQNDMPNDGGPVPEEVAIVGRDDFTSYLVTSTDPKMAMAVSELQNDTVPPADLFGLNLVQRQKYHHSILIV